MFKEIGKFENTIFKVCFVVFFMGRYEIVFHDFAATSEKVIKFE